MEFIRLDHLDIVVFPIPIVQRLYSGSLKINKQKRETSEGKVVRIADVKKRGRGEGGPVGRGLTECLSTSQWTYLQSCRNRPTDHQPPANKLASGKLGNGGLTSRNI